MLTAAQIDKLQNVCELEVYYKSPYKTKWAIVRYYCRKGKPYKVAKYDIRGERLMAGEPIRCFEYMASTNFNIVEDDFDTEEEAITRMKELRSAE